MTSNKYTILITANNEAEKLSFLELPENIIVSHKGKNKSIDVLGLGEIIVINDRPSIAVKFSSVFISEKCVPQECIDLLIKWKNLKKPVHLIVTGFDINIFCSVESFDYHEKGGDVGSIYFNISLNEYRQPIIKTIKAINNNPPSDNEVSRVDNRIKPKTYTVKKGDCLYNIAKSQLGNANKWPQISKINNIKSPYLIFPNQVLKLP